MARQPIAFPKVTTILAALADVRFGCLEISSLKIVVEDRNDAADHRSLFTIVMMASHVATTVHTQAPDQEKISSIPPSAKKDAYAFAMAVVEGMAGYIDAEESVAAQTQAAPMVDAVNRLAANRTAEAKWGLAASHLTRFRTSKDTVLADFSKELGAGYTLMSELYGQRVALQEAILKNTISKPADMIIEASKIQSKSDQVLDLIALGTAAVANCMIDLCRADGGGHARYLKLMFDEKADITNRLKTLAGPSPEDETTDDKRSTARVPALVLRRWFRQGWHGSDRDEWAGRQSVRPNV